MIEQILYDCNESFEIINGNKLLNMHKGLISFKKNGRLSINKFFFLFCLVLSSFHNWLLIFAGNICHYEEIKFILLMGSVPLNHFSLKSNDKFDQQSSRNFEVTLCRLIENFQNTLGEIINIYVLICTI